MARLRIAQANAGIVIDLKMIGLENIVQRNVSKIFKQIGA